MRRKDREVLGAEEIVKIIGRCKVCHLGMTDGSEPYVVPMNFGFELRGETLRLVFHCAKKGRKLDILKKNSRVCFEMADPGEPLHPDTPCNSGYYYASVIGYGNIRILTDTEEKCAALTLLMKHQSGTDPVFTKAQADTVCVFEIVSNEYTGKCKKKK